MKIGIVTNWSNSGAGQVSKLIAHILKTQGQSISVYARPENDGRERLQQNNREYEITMGRASFSIAPKAVNIPHFKTWILRNRLDTVIFNEQIDLSPVFLARKLGIKTIGYVDYYKRNTVSDFRLYDALLCVTLRHYEVFKWHPQAWYLPWGGLQKCNLSHEREVKYDFFHSVGTSPFRKGTDLVLEALDHAQVGGETRLAIHSMYDLRTLMPDRKFQIDKLTKEKKLVCFYGNSMGKCNYPLSDFYIYPSRLDGIGISLIEAMQHGMIPIVTNSPPMTEFVRDDLAKLLTVESVFAREDGYYWPLNEASVQSLVTCIESASNEDIERRKEQTNRINAHYNAELDIENNFNNLSSLIASLGSTKATVSSAIAANQHSSEVTLNTNSSIGKAYLWLISLLLRGKHVVGIFPITWKNLSIKRKL